MNLVIDIGNTAIKVAQFEKNECLNVERFNESKPFLEFCLPLKLENTIISSVRDKVFTSNIISHFPNGLLLTHITNLPIINLYESPETLGNDRISNAVGAFLAFPGQNTLIVDVGTCLKLDFINSQNEYLGGSISPGLQMRFRALHTLTDNLPLIEDVEINQLFGKSTSSSIQVGVYQGMIAEMSNMICQYEKEYANLNIILTGGDLSWFSTIGLSQKNSIFADDLLTLKGLNTILNYNV